ncbi:Low molecular weight heat shock protein [Rhodanobacter sp. Root179]|jgi:HSP20 family protein|uniref:Hsp20/alpha crystallin family protein n=1 Tax=unclassified Rhodanobacter TaxID=2621553 RepID=UPI0006F1E0DE|nr:MULTISPECIES: Hsp20/alpha crystallin family protein [unclassified Rhodanobacter]KQZ74717.1 heat-shock protein Hsp20 [Rhodanobacter sp. Root561]KRB33907.1 heat-shock protein Hsp20 [Rhodanobacter sp. Root179]QRP65266.1 Hsp20/alpha crystallin family protein [Rhodanobacter sp. FDAARGOS 1247]
MNLGRHGIWNAGNGLPEEIRQAFDRFLQPEDGDASNVVTSQWAPRVDIREDEQRFVILADIPGVDPAQIEVSMDKGILTIKGERDAVAAEKDGKFTRVERARGAFHRRFALPDSADAEGVTATGKFGVLEIVIPKKAQATPRRITINVNH